MWSVWLACRTDRGDLKLVLCFHLQGSPGLSMGVVQGKVRLFRPQTRLGTAWAVVNPGSHLSHRPSPGKQPRLYGHSVCIICISLPPPV